MHGFIGKEELISRDRISQGIDFLDENNYFNEKFLLSQGYFDNGEGFGEILYRDTPDKYLRYTIGDNVYQLDTIFAPGGGSVLLLALFYIAILNGVRFIELNARTNDEILNTQEELENWYRNFGFETLSRDIDGTKMRACVYNRPLAFRIESLIKRTSEYSNTLIQ